mmetsp:Transcript_8932/g.15133  ORF Transcript_8932/g.15133 Transcript_8932/m.15133 type:complete len:106 (-) Transcript_8932:17-334(-)
MAMEYKHTQDQMAQEMGFDYSSECFIKGERTVIILMNIGGLNEVNNQPIEKSKDEDYWLLVYFEMEPLKAELFDCDQFIISIDDLVVQLIDGLRLDKEDFEEYSI